MKRITKARENVFMQWANSDYEIVIGEGRSTDYTRKAGGLWN
jgi:hypothetical protein